MWGDLEPAELAVMVGAALLCLRTQTTSCLSHPEREILEVRDSRTWGPKPELGDQRTIHMADKRPWHPCSEPAANAAPRPFFRRAWTPAHPPAGQDVQGGRNRPQGRVHSFASKGHGQMLTEEGWPESPRLPKQRRIHVRIVSHK